MSDSDDDIPLRPRAVGLANGAKAKPNVVDSSSDDEKPLIAKVVKKANGGKAKHAMRDSSDEDGPILKKAKPKGANNAHANGLKPKEPVRAPAAPAKKAEPKPRSNGAAANTGEKQKREKKVFPNPGQTKETPEEVDPLRKFYESLHRQRPESMMAKKWLLSVGLLSEDEAQRVLAELGKLKVGGGRTPVKPSRTARDTVPAKQKRRDPAPVKKGKKRKDESDSSDSEDEVLPKKRQRVSADDDDFKPIRPKPSAAPAKKKLPTAKRDVAFLDGGLDDSSDSDDDKPLISRMKKA